MVYFNCAGCGNGFKKNQIEQHRYACKSRVFSCIDCSKDFKDDEYKMHTRCITESEKYESKSSYIAKANKGDLKQNAWLEKVMNAVTNFKGSNRAKSLLEKLVDYPNIPRKKAKFFNFAKNSFRSFGVNDSLLEEIWTVIESFDKQQQQQQQQQQIQQPAIKRKLDETPNEQDVKKKIKSDNENTTQQLQCQDETIKFDWIDLIRHELNKNESHQISLAKLSKKLFKKYKKLKQVDRDDEANTNEESFNKKLMKKLKKNFSLFHDDNTRITTTTTNDATLTSNLESIIVKLNE